MRLVIGLPPGRRNRFDLMRLVMAVAVIFGHSYALTQGNYSQDPLNRFSRGVTYSGSLAVSVFFIISGFLIARSWVSTPDIGKFLKKRCLRIFPGYIAAVALSIGVVLPLASNGFADGAHQVFLGIAMEPLKSDLAFVANPYPHTINGSLWTIRYELYCYLLAALLGLAGCLNRRWVPSLLLVICLCALGAQAGWNVFPSRTILGIGQWSVWPGLLTSFMVGVGFFAWREVVPVSGVLAAMCAIFLALMLRWAPPAVAATSLPVMTGYLVFFLAYFGVAHRDTSVRVSRPDLSYGTYLYAFPIQQLLAQLMPGITSIAMFSLATVLSLTTALLSWYAVERPFLRRAESRLKQKIRPLRDCEIAEPHARNKFRIAPAPV